MRAKTIVYWTMTILVAFPIGSGGVAQIAQYLVQNKVQVYSIVPEKIALEEIFLKVVGKEAGL